jgi:hypothetical protein
MVEDMPATCPTGGVTAGSHGLSRSARQPTRRSANPQVTAVLRHRLPKLIVRVRFPSPLREKPQLTPLSIDGAFRSTATHDPIRAISVQLACWRGHARSAIVPILVVGLLSLDVCIHRLGDGLVSTPGRVLVDDRSALAVVTHPDHQIPEPRAAGRREDVPRVAQIMKVQTLGADGPCCVRPARELVEVATPQWAALGARKDQRYRIRASEQGQMSLQQA